MKKLFIVCLLLIPMISCNQHKNELKNIQGIKNHFSTEEIKILSSIVNYLDERIRSDKTIQKSYEVFFQHVNKAEVVSDFINIVKEYLPGSTELLNQIPKDVFNKIWNSKFMYNLANNDSINILSLNYGGDYFQFLKEFSKSEDSVLSNYFEGFEIAGDLSPSMVALIQKKWDHLDMKNEGIRLIIAIHYLTIVESKVVIRNREIK